MASLRSRIRGGLTNCEVGIFPAAQFLTLRLVISVATKVFCVDLDGPGHAPPYLCVSAKLTLYHSELGWFLNKACTYSRCVNAGLAGIGICDGMSQKLNKCRGLKVLPMMYTEIAGPEVFPGDHRSAFDFI